METLPVYTDFQTISALREARGGSESERLEGVAQQFSAVFTHMMLKSMRQASLGEGIFDSNQSHFYRDMFDQQLALELSGKEGTGFTGMLVDHLRQVTGAEKATESDPKLAGRPVNTGLRQVSEYRSVQDLVQEPVVPADILVSPTLTGPRSSI